MLGLLSLLDLGTTATWLQDMGRSDLAVEALLLQADGRGRQKGGEAALCRALIATLDTAEIHDAGWHRARVLLLDRLSQLGEADAFSVKIALLAADRRVAQSADGGAKRTLLGGALRRAVAYRMELAEAITRAPSVVLRRHLEALHRRAALLEGALLLDLEASGQRVRKALRVALLGMADMDQLDLSSMPPGMLQQEDAAWAAHMLALLAIDERRLNAAEKWIDGLLWVRSPVLDTARPNALVLLLQTLEPDSARALLTLWESSMSDAALLAVVESVEAMDELTVGALEARGLSDVMARTVARARRPLPSGTGRTQAMATWHRALRGDLPWASAIEALQMCRANQGADDVLLLALGRSLLEVGRDDQALPVLQAVQTAGAQAKADELLLSALTRQVSGDGNSDALNPTLDALLQRIIARGIDDPAAPGVSQALLHGAARARTLESALALLNALPVDDSLQPRAVQLRATLTWAALQAGQAVHGHVVDAARRQLDLDEADAGAGTRLLFALPQASLSPRVVSVLSARALDAIEVVHGPGVAAAHRSLHAQWQGDWTAALHALEQAWAQGARDAPLRRAAASLLRAGPPLGAPMTTVAARVLGRSPMGLSPDPLPPDDRDVLVQWARHLVVDATIDIDVLRHAATLGVLGQDGFVSLAKRASAAREWTLAEEAWRRASHFGGPSQAALELERARVLVHLDPSAGRALAGQLAVLHAGTPVGEAAAALAASLRSGL
jgi:hypothetical protein